MISSWLFAGSKLIKIVAWALVVGAIIGTILFTANYLYQLGHTSGTDKSEAKWQKKHAEAISEKARNYQTVRETLRNREIEFGEITDKLAKTQNKDRKYAERAKDISVAAARDGTIKLYDITRECGNERSGSNGEVKLPTATARTNGSGGRKLSTKLAAFLVAESSRADRIAYKLKDLQEYTSNLFNTCSTRK